MNLKIYIIEKGMNQNEFAAKLGITKQRLSEMVTKGFIVEDGWIKSNRRDIMQVEGVGSND